MLELHLKWTNKTFLIYFIKGFYHTLMHHFLRNRKSHYNAGSQLVTVMFIFFSIFSPVQWGFTILIAAICCG